MICTRTQQWFVSMKLNFENGSRVKFMTNIFAIKVVAGAKPLFKNHQERSGADRISMTKYFQE